VTEAYVKCLSYTHGKLFLCFLSWTLLTKLDVVVSLAGSVVSLVAAFGIKEHIL
jgi:hypothetical protein